MSRNNVVYTMAVVGVLIISAASVWAFQSSSLLGKRREWPWFASSSSSSSSTPTLPADVVKYSQVPKQGQFTATTIPKGLLKDHNTKSGTWGLIRVSRGKLEYTMLEPRQLVLELMAPAAGVIIPQKLHHVKALSDDVEFVVEFYRKPGTGPVDEKREGL